MKLNGVIRAPINIAESALSFQINHNNLISKLCRQETQNEQEEVQDHQNCAITLLILTTFSHRFLVNF